MKPPRRILVAPLRFIGDGILTVPLLRALHETYENAQIDVLLPKHLVNLFERCPYVHEILPEPDSPWEMMAMLRPRAYHLGFVMRRSLSQALWFKLAGIRHLVGYDDQRFPPPLNYRRWGWFLDTAVPFPALDTVIPQVQTYLALLNVVNPGQWDESLELWADEEDKLKIAALFNRYGVDVARPIALVHITSASREKAMSVAQFIPSVQALHQQGMQVLAMGPESEGPIYHTLSEAAGVPVINLCGETTLRQSFALMLKVQLLLSLDSAPIHMGAAAGVPHIVGIYGPTNEKQWRPYPYEGAFTPVYNTRLKCRPCAPKLCSHNQCRVDLAPAEIFEAMMPHLQAVMEPHEPAHS